MPKLVYTTDVADAVAKIRQVNEESGRKAQEALQGTAKESQKLSALQKRLLRETETAQEKYNKKLDALKGLYDKNKISADKYNAAVVKIGREYETSSRAAKKAADAGDRAYGPNASQSLLSFASQLGTVLGPIALIRAGWDDVVQAKERAFEVNREARFSSGQLRQLANTQAEYDDLRSKQKELFTSGATKTLEQAGLVVFDITSSGLMNDDAFKIFKELGQTGTIKDLSSFSQAITRMSSAFGEGETGSTKAIISKAFSASEFSSANVPQLLTATATVGPIASMLGLSDEETLAGVTALSKTSTAMEGATSLKALLFSTAEKEGFEGLSLVERVQKLRGMNMSPGDMKKYLGRKEGVRAYADLLKTGDVYDAALQGVTRANVDTAAVDRKIAFRDPITRAAAGVDSLEAQGVIDFEKEGALRQYLNAVRERNQQRAYKDAGPVGRPFEMLGGAFDKFVRDPSNTALLGEANQAQRVMNDPRTTEEERDIFRQLLKATEDGVKEQKETNRKLSEGGLIGVAE